MTIKIKTGRENKPHIGIFGRCNAGKSTMLNFITCTDTAIVSPEGGTTTDLVRKSYEIPGFAPVIFVDTGGTDDTSRLGAERMARTREAMMQVDLAIVVYTSWGEPEERLAAELAAATVPYVCAHNDIGGAAGREPCVSPGTGPYPVGDEVTDVSAVGNPEQHYRKPIPGPSACGKGCVSFDILNGTPEEHASVIELIKSALPEDAVRPVTMLGDTVAPGDTVILVCPIDSEAPAGRMILPQMQAVREALDRNAVAVVVQPEQLVQALGSYPAIRLVVTDSQVYSEVRKAVSEGTEVTTFSILLAAAKGDMKLYTEGLAAVDRLRDGDRVLIAENCAHQVSCDDIGRVKIPAWLRAYTGRELEFTFVSGLSPLPSDLGQFALMVQCGGCMVTRSQLRNRIRKAAAAGLPVTNYGMLIKKVRP